MRQLVNGMLIMAGIYCAVPGMALATEIGLVKTENGVRTTGLGAARVDNIATILRFTAGG